MINNLFTLKQAFAALASFAARLLGKFGYREDYEWNGSIQHSGLKLANNSLFVYITQFIFHFSD